MKVLLQNKSTLLYFKRPEDWTASIEDASDFMHSERAINFAREQLLEDVRLVVAFRESGQFQTLSFKAQIPPPQEAGFHPIPAAHSS